MEKTEDSKYEETVTDLGAKTLKRAKELLEGTKGGKEARALGIELLKSAIAAGNTDAGHHYARVLRKGWYGVQQDIHQARTLLEVCSRNDHAGAQQQLGRMYEDGEGGLEVDAQKAAELFRRAIENGNVGAFLNLALLYHYGGNNLEANIEKGVGLYEEGLSKGDADCAYCLGTIYESGRRGKPRDLAIALNYYKMASQKGHKKSIAKLERLAPSLLRSSDDNLSSSGDLKLGDQNTNSVLNEVNMG